MGRDFWQAHIEAWRASGETQAGYCRRVGVSQFTFSGWKRRLERERLAQGSGDEATALLAVELSEPTPESGRTLEAGITVEVGDDVRVRLSPDFDADSLTRAVMALRDARG